MALVATGCATGEAPPPPAADAVERIVRDYLVRHPEIVVEALQAARERERMAAGARAREAILAQQAELLHDPASPVAGNPQGDVTLVEFLDYN